MTVHTCPCCGSIQDAPETKRLEDIPANEHVKRAMEVALVGNHTIAFTGWQAHLFAAWIHQYQIVAIPVQPCPCGNFGSPRYECKCTVEMVREWRNTQVYRNALSCDIWIQCVEPREYQLNDRRRENQDRVAERVNQAAHRPMPNPLLDETCLALQRAFLSQVGHPEDIERIHRVTASIARLADSKILRPAHLAEAMQYRPSQDDR